MHAISTTQRQSQLTYVLRAKPRENPKGILRRGQAYNVEIRAKPKVNTLREVLIIFSTICPLIISETELAKTGPSRRANRFCKEVSRHLKGLEIHTAVAAATKDVVAPNSATMDFHRTLIHPELLLVYGA